jgi:Flp pilus assembly pilin Flp
LRNAPHETARVALPWESCYTASEQGGGAPRAAEAAADIAKSLLFRRRKPMGFLFSDSNESGQSFLEYALIIVLIAIVVLAILLILGDDIRVFVIDLWDKALRLITGQ